ncbi:hypothetical protein LCGC14_1679520, partial [marine sediment metagenome]
GRPVFRMVNMVDRPDLDKEKNYLGGVDGAEGVRGGDNHCFAMIDPSPKARVVYEHVSNEPIDVFCKRVKEMCSDYKIRLGVEKNGVGVAHVNKLIELGVSFTSWDTTASSRPVLISELEESYRKDELLETYLEAKNELLDMFYDDKNKPVHPANKHDDRVFARGIAWQMRKGGEPTLRLL